MTVKIGNATCLVRNPDFCRKTNGTGVCSFKQLVPLIDRRRSLFLECASNPAVERADDLPSVQNALVVRGNDGASAG